MSTGTNHVFTLLLSQSVYPYHNIIVLPGLCEVFSRVFTIPKNDGLHSLLLHEATNHKCNGQSWWWWCVLAKLISNQTSTTKKRCLRATVVQNEKKLLYYDVNKKRRSSNKKYVFLAPHYKLMMFLLPAVSCVFLLLLIPTPKCTFYPIPLKSHQISASLIRNRHFSRTVPINIVYWCRNILLKIAEVCVLLRRFYTLQLLHLSPRYLAIISFLTHYLL